MRANLPAKIAHSRYTLVVCIVLYAASFLMLRQDMADGGEGGILWQWLDKSLPALTVSRWSTLALHVLALYMLLELDTVFALIRQRTLFQLSALLLFLSAMPAVFNVSAATIGGMLVFYALFPFFFSYQGINNALRMMQSGIALGLASLFYPHALLLAVLFVVAMPSMRNFSPRNLFGLLWGAAIPYFFLATYAFCTDRMQLVNDALSSIVEFDGIDYGTLGTGTALNLGLMLLFAATSITHATYTSYNDKIKTRILLYFLCWLSACIIIAATVLPSDAADLMSLATMPTALLMAHTVTLLDTRGGTVYVIVMAAAMAGVFTINYVI